jgi:hypothetical protein
MHGITYQLLMAKQKRRLAQKSGEPKKSQKVIYNQAKKITNDN